MYIARQASSLLVFPFHAQVDDLFSEDKKKPKSKKKKAKGRPDEDLFGNTDDIFGDIPAPKPKAPKGKKKKKQTTKTSSVKPEPEESKGGGEGDEPPTEGTCTICMKCCLVNYITDDSPTEGTICM